MKDNKNKKPFYKRWWFIAIVVIGIIGAIFEDEDADPKVEEPISSQEVSQDEIENESKKEEQTDIEENIVDLEVRGDLEVEFKEDKAIVVVKTNAIDGSVFEVSLLDAEFRTISDFITVTDGKAKKEFEVDKDWEPGYIGTVALMRFDLEDEPQPENVKEAYGENGGKLKGGLIKENVVEGYNIALETEPVPYPDKETVTSIQNKFFEKGSKELIESSGGVVVGIKPYLQEGDWSTVAVTVSDVWYNSQEHEKERFAEQLQQTVSTLVKNGGKTDPDENVGVYFFDTYGKELATPKMFGGYKIKQ